MATSRRSPIAVFVIVLTIGAAAFFTANAPNRVADDQVAASGLAERAISATPPLAPKVQSSDGRSDGDAGRRLPTSFGFFGLAALALGLAAVYANHQRDQRGAVLAVALAHQGPRAPPRSVAFVR